METEERVFKVLLPLCGVVGEGSDDEAKAWVYALTRAVLLGVAI